jgi:hypothetical protein
MSNAIPWSDILQKGRHDSPNDTAIALEQRTNRKPRAGFSLAHSYAEHEISLHVHFRLRHIWNQAPPSYYCAVYEWADSSLALLDFDIDARTPLRAFDSGSDDAQPTVLISDIEFIDVPQDLANGGTVVRLHPLNQCERFWIDSGKLVRLYGLPRARIIEDWKRWSIFRTNLTPIDEEVGGVIESRAERMDALANQTRPFFKRRMFDDLGAPEKCVPLALRVILKEHSVRVATEKGGMFAIQLAEVFFSPLKLHAGTGEGIDHKASLS